MEVEDTNRASAQPAPVEPTVLCCGSCSDSLSEPPSRRVRQTLLRGPRSLRSTP